MDLKGKGSLLLLVMSNLVLFLNVASHRICHDDLRCQVNLHELYNSATFTSLVMQFHAKDFFREFGKEYVKDSSYFFPAMKSCHTADILAPADKREARLMQQEQLFNLVIRYLRSWRDALLQLGLEAHRLPKFQFDLEIPDNVEYSLWLEKESLESPDEQARLFTVYNTLRCLVSDTNKIHFLLSFLNCLAYNQRVC
ncbi:PREDICTED: prolactin-like [Chinchilla lanigera]|uniref:prolactin-like n=1 Tax=Chinchilla lanigera TaxID=34839 RepID=UPI00038EFC03|nr:PREDICTED: prolactin-like [Chinchilla lanigera]